MYILF